jgi:hypothetical protein
LAKCIHLFHKTPLRRKKRLAKKWNRANKTIQSIKRFTTTTNTSIAAMAQPDAADAAWLAECVRDYGRVPAALFEARLSAVRAELLQQHEQQLAEAHQQHQAQLAAVHQQLEARNQELASSNQALATVRAALAQVSAPEHMPAQNPAADQQPVHVAPDIVQPPAQRARLGPSDEHDLRDAESAYTVDHDGYGLVSRDCPTVSARNCIMCLVMNAGVLKATLSERTVVNTLWLLLSLLRLHAQAHAAAYWRMHQSMVHSSVGNNDQGACVVFNALSEADKVSVAVLQTINKRNSLLTDAFYIGCLQCAKLLVSKGATKELVRKPIDSIGDWLMHYTHGSTSAQATEGLALLVLLGFPVKCAWTNIGTTTQSYNWKKSDSTLRGVLHDVLSALRLSVNKEALAGHLITSLDATDREQNGKVVDVSVCQFDAVKQLMPDNTPDWLVALVATIFSTQYEQGGPAIAQQMRPIIIDHFNFDIPA